MKYFYTQTQNKILFAITAQTAIEIIINRADATQPKEQEAIEADFQDLEELKQIAQSKD